MNGIQETNTPSFGGDLLDGTDWVEVKTWLSKSDERVRETHAYLDGQLVHAEAEFTSKSGAKAQYPGGFGVAAEDINCRCTVKYTLMKKDEFLAQGGIIPGEENSADGLTESSDGGIINTNRQGEPTKRDVKLSDEAKSYDEQLQKKSDYITGKSGAFREDDVRRLSAKNGVEYACLTIGDESVLIRGDSGSTSISDEFLDRLVKGGGTFDYHTHPYDGDIIPSQSDMALMGKLSGLTGQETSKIISTDGKTADYNKEGVIGTGRVKNEIDEEYRQTLMRLFGGE